MTTKRLVRNVNSKMIGGVASRIYFEIDPTIIRIVFAIAVLSPIMFPVGLFYFILWAIISKSIHSSEDFRTTTNHETSL